MSQDQAPQQDNLTPFLEDIINFLRPRIVEERRDSMLKLAVAWVVEELKMYKNATGIDDITCGVELHKCKAKIDNEGTPMEIFGYQLLLALSTDEPQHDEKQADCFFVMQPGTDVIYELMLPGQRPDGTDGRMKQ
jgi:hypothetical protein